MPAAVVAASLFVYVWFTGAIGGNVRVVAPRRVYRSAQLTGHALNRVLQADGIRTVINLRGAAPKDAWYRSEIATCSAHRVAHIDIVLSAHNLPPPKQLEKLLAAFDRARYPVLFHCQGGSDRSGLVGAIYLNVYRNVPLDQAEQSQLAWRYGHLPFGPAHAMDEFFDLYRRTNGNLSLRDWIVLRYPNLYSHLAASSVQRDAATSAGSRMP